MPTFVILAHRDPEQVLRLLRRLAPHPVVVQLDRTTPAADFADVRAEAAAFGHDVDVHWGGFSLVEATLSAYRAASGFTAAHDYVVLLSGQSYPVRPVESLVEHLAAAEGRQFARSYWLDGLPASLRDHVRQRWYFDSFHARTRVGASAGRVARRLAHDVAATCTPARPLDGIAFGSQWTALTGEAVSHVLAAEAGSPVRAALRRSFAPDELFIASLLAESGFPGTHPQRASASQLHGWDPKLNTGPLLDGNLHVLPRDLRTTWTRVDPVLLQDAGRFFVRKVDAVRGARLMDDLDALAVRR